MKIHQPQFSIAENSADFFFSIHTYTHAYTHVQFEQLHKYIQKRSKIYKKWYTQKQSLDIKLFGISRKQKNI